MFSFGIRLLVNVLRRKHVLLCCCVPRFNLKHFVTKMNKVFFMYVCICVASTSLFNSVDADGGDSVPEATQRYNRSSDEDLGSVKAQTLFKSLFRRKRAEQIGAVKTILNFGQYEKQYKMISVMLQKMFDIISSAKVIIEGSDYIPGSSFPHNDTVKEALSQVLENTAFFGELRLKVPDITALLISKHRDWQFLITWSIGFSNSTSLYDAKTEELIHLLAQEMDLIERDPNFVNPYKIKKIELPASSSAAKKAAKKKNATSRGPRMSKHKHTEL